MITDISREFPQIPRPLPELNITIRPGVLSDVPFLDALQKLHTKQVGWMPTKQFEGKIKAGHVWSAEEGGGRGGRGEERGERGEGRGGTGEERGERGERREAMEEEGAADGGGSSLSPIASRPSPLLSPLASPSPLAARPSPLSSLRPVGYLIGNDQYFKRDDVGIIYQLNVLPGRQRGLIGASLLKAQFERSAWGCKLYCCWCAQDIAANHFWEAMGFVPLAFRAGSEKRSRVHIFWQKRIRAGDTSTAWWFPSKTAGGSIREDRIVLPILPGTHWSDAKPLILPNAPGSEEASKGWLGQRSSDAPALACERESNAGAAADLSPSHPTPEAKPLPAPKREKVKKPKAAEPPGTAAVRRNGLMFNIPKPGEALPGAGLPGAAKGAKQARPKAEKVKRVCDPRLASAARELRDRWLERVNDTPLLDAAKYDVTRAISDEGRVEMEVVKRLTAA